ncbi:hypothetical protein [Streptomyces sp. NPDC059761]|uniref:hypothetical protein n=1 Tax=Streptomyces sp. NPDC059761 TaxID=3346937 RepID=UPI00366A2BDC
MNPARNGRTADPEKGNFLLYDYDFPLESNPKYTVPDSLRALHVPHFGIGEIAGWVFAKEAEWLRRQVHPRKMPLTFSGRLLDIRQVSGRGTNAGRTSNAERRLTLPDIERLAWVLYERGMIDGLEFSRAYAVIVAVADQYLGTPLEDS